jgi:hypothetical protein
MLAAGSEIGQGKVLFLESDLRTSQAAAYAAVECIQFDGAHYDVLRTADNARRVCRDDLAEH